MMNAFAIGAVLLVLLPGVPAPPGKNTISAANPMTSVAFNLKYLPVTMAEDNGNGDEMSGTDIQGRSQVLQNNSYTARNCQLYTSVGQLKAESSYQSMTSNGLGKACSYTSSKQYASGNKLHMVFAYNKAQCCNACVATAACVAASFQTSTKDHTGGQGPQEWEGFGIHITDVTSAKTTDGLAVSALESDFKARLGDHSAFDQFMDYSATFFTYDLQPYVDAFKADRVSHFVGQWKHKDDAWYSLIFLVEGSHYVIELVSTIKPTDVNTMPLMEQRMSDAHCEKFSLYQSHPAHVLLISSINRATSNIAQIEDVYTNLFQAKTTHTFDGEGVTKRCYSFDTSTNRLQFPPGPGGQALDEDVCFTARAADAAKDKILSVKGFEEMLWAVHAATIGNNADSMIDKYTDNHYALPLPAAGLSALSNFTSDDPYPITKDTRLAYACKQNYIIDPTGWSIQPIGQASWPKCSRVVVV